MGPYTEHNYVLSSRVKEFVWSVLLADGDRREACVPVQEVRLHDEADSIVSVVVDVPSEHDGGTPDTPRAHRCPEYPTDKQLL